jgi:threonyl-tRNA synthetase
MQELTDQSIRVDLDDRQETVSKRIREAETDWVPYILVVGENEKSSGKFKARVRESGEQKDFTLKSLAEEIKSKTAGKPFKPLPLPQLISERPRFV